MKTLLKSFTAGLLALLARAIVAKYRPTIVMVTGSVGKTSTKDAIAAALAPRFYLRASEKSYNSEFGVPLTIIGAKNPWENASAWLSVVGEAFALILLPSHFPKLLVLEVGADRPGDLARILRIATPDAVVVTRLPEVPVHVEAYATPGAVRDEEFTPAYALPAGAPLVISSDNEYATEMAARLPLHTLTYGAGEEATVRVGDAGALIEAGRLAGMQGTLTVAGAAHPLTIPGALGRSQLYAPAAATALGLALGMSVEEILEGLRSYLPPPGRARLLSGIHGSLIIDDSYNASPAAVEEVLGALALAPRPGRRIAVLGDMLELGRYSMSEHERIGQLASKEADVVVSVGTRARAIGTAAVVAGLAPEQVHAFDNSNEAAEAIISMVTHGDIILVKGSQSIRMERIVEALLADPADLPKLVRQDKEWKKR